MSHAIFCGPRMTGSTKAIADALLRQGWSCQRFAAVPADLPHADVVVGRGSMTHAERLDAFRVMLVYEATGVTAVNPVAAQVLMADKRLTERTLLTSDIPTPDLVRSWPGNDVIVKPACGSKGEGVALCRTEREMEVALTALRGAGIAQRYVAGRVLRVIATRREAVLAYAKDLPPGGGVVANIARGARSVRVTPDASTISAAVRTVQAFGAQIAGVDIILTERGPVVLEANNGFRVPTEFENAADLIATAIVG